MPKIVVQGYEADDAGLIKHNTKLQINKNYNNDLLPKVIEKNFQNS
ncbi:hypothetical protein [Mycoplasmopsis synoviae]|uniref:Uncharacterized protein n=1 Tax=Mycoplasmopsis synoviae TaxID=2109 RepID=A0A3B0PTF7_MYCSY|nr:hypothetical protein [Mycoplasmopsis synoviae]SYV92833.1 Uncharacterised protein [Mycoplasmopsis synoviae]